MAHLNAVLGRVKNIPPIERLLGLPIVEQEEEEMADNLAAFLGVTRKPVENEVEDGED